MLKINESFYHLHGKDPYVLKNHSHNEIEFIGVISGNGLVVKNDKTHVLRSQHIYVIDARKTHIVYPKPEDCRHYVRNKIVIEADSFMEFYGKMGMEEIIEKLFESESVSTAASPVTDRIFKTVSDLMSSGKKEDIAFAHGYITELIHWIYSNCETKAHTESMDTFQKMLGIINEKEGFTTLSEISALLHTDKYYLCRLFKAKSGVTLSEYISEKIYEKSRKLIEGTSLSIGEIATECGFSSQASFTRFFKNKCGMSPIKYRKGH